MDSIPILSYGLKGKNKNKKCMVYITKFWWSSIWYD